MARPKTKKLPDNKRMSVMVPAKMTPPEHKLFLKILKEDATLLYASQLMRKILVEYLAAYQARKTPKVDTIEDVNEQPT